MHHPNPTLNILINKLKLIREKRLKSDLHTISNYITDLDFFTDKGIIGHDLLEIAECMTY